MGFDLCKAQGAWLFPEVDIGCLNLKESKDKVKEDGLNVKATSKINLEEKGKEDDTNVGTVSSLAMLKVPNYEVEGHEVP